MCWSAFQFQCHNRTALCSHRTDKKFNQHVLPTSTPGTIAETTSCNICTIIFNKYSLKLDITVVMKLVSDINMQMITGQAQKVCKCKQASKQQTLILQVRQNIIPLTPSLHRHSISNQNQTKSKGWKRICLKKKLNWLIWITNSSHSIHDYKTYRKSFENIWILVSKSILWFTYEPFTRWYFLWYSLFNKAVYFTWFIHTTV